MSNRMTTLLLIIILLTTGCNSGSSSHALQGTRWKFIDEKYDSNYAWDTFEIYISRKTNRIAFTVDSFIHTRNDSLVTFAKYSIQSDSLILDFGKSIKKCGIQKLTRDTLILHSNIGVTSTFTRQ